MLVNNAGTSRAMAFETVTDAIWQEDLDLKLFAAIRLSRLVWRGMRCSKRRLPAPALSPPNSPKWSPE